MWFWHVGVFHPNCISVLALCDSYAKGEMNLLCCIFLHSCKAERKKGCTCVFFAGFSGFFSAKILSSFHFWLMKFYFILYFSECRLWELLESLPVTVMKQFHSPCVTLPVCSVSSSVFLLILYSSSWKYNCEWVEVQMSRSGLMNASK